MRLHAGRSSSLIKAHQPHRLLIADRPIDLLPSIPFDIYFLQRSELSLTLPSPCLLHLPCSLIALLFSLQFINWWLEPEICFSHTSPGLAFKVYHLIYICFFFRKLFSLFIFLHILLYFLLPLSLCLSRSFSITHYTRLLFISTAIIVIGALPSIFI